ncbi:MAG: hypothetical protein Q8R13_00515 [bacterium]|nr:hypothetical protein [bacterium]
MSLNQKGFVNIISVVAIIILLGAVGYFAFIKKSGSMIPQPTPTPTQFRGNLENKPFVKIQEDEGAIYYEGYMSASGTYSRGVNSFLFDLDPDQEHLFPDLKATDYADGKTHLSFESSEELLNLIPQKTKLAFIAKKGAPCRVIGKATVIISGYKAMKSIVPGNYNTATLAKVLSSTEESYTYWKQREGVQEEILDCTGVTP